MVEIDMELVEVGMFRLPGVKFEYDEDDPRFTEERIEEMKQWAKDNKCGTYLTNKLWSFRSEAKRNFFIIRWAS